MKKKLAAHAKAAFDAAKADKQFDPELLAALEADWKAKQAAVDAEDQKAAGTPTAGDGNKAADATVTLDEISTAVTAQIKTLLDARLPEGATALTAEQVKKIVADEFAAQNKTDAKALNIDDIKAVTNAALTKAAESIKMPSKLQHSQADHDRQMVEIPTSWVKGNLPVHGKQLLNILMKRPMDHGIAETDLRKAVAAGDQMIARYQRMAANGIKALTSTGAGTGDEFVPTDLSAELQRRLYLMSDLAAIFAAREIDMPTQPYRYPLVTTRPTFYLETTENTAATASDPGTAELTLDAKKLMGKVAYSYEVDEDSIVPILATIQTLLAEAAAAAYESALINGDTTATHQDSDTETIPKAAERAFKGFRKLALAVSALKKDLSSGGLNEANLRAMKKLMGKYGIKLRDLIWVAGPLGVNDIEAITNVATIDKYGPKATILTGEISNFLGIPIIRSEAVRENLNAAGVYDGTTTTKGSILLLNQTRFLTGRRRAFTVETDKDISSQTNIIVASFRKAFTPLEVPSATVPTVIVGYNHTA